MNKKRKQMTQKLKVFGVVSLIALAVGGVLTTVGMSRALKEIHGIEISKTPNAILASAGLDDDSEVTLNVIYFDHLNKIYIYLYLL